MTENGPFFPGLSPGHQQFSWANAEASLEHMTKAPYTNWWLSFCDYVGGDLLYSKRALMELFSTSE